MSQPFLSRVERGLAGLSLTSVDRIAEALGISAAGLFGTMASDDRHDVVCRSERPRIQLGGDWAATTAYTRRSGQVSMRSAARLLLVLVSEDVEFVVSPEPGRASTRPAAPRC